MTMQQASNPLNALQFTLSSMIPRDNIALSYFYNVLLVMVIGLISQINVSYYLRAIMSWLQRERAISVPELNFNATKQGSVISCTEEVEAWLWFIRTKTVPLHSKEKKGILQLNQEVGGVKNSMWFPVNNVWFEVETGILGYITTREESQGGAMPHIKNKASVNDLFGGYGRRNYGNEGKSHPAATVDGKRVHMKLTLQTSLELGLQYLLDRTKIVKEEYQFYMNQEELKGPQIFHFLGCMHGGDLQFWENPHLNWAREKFCSNRQFDQMWFEQREEFVNAYEMFLNGKEEYSKRGDPYTFTLLLHGTPGCGKTSLIKSIVNYDRKVRGIVSHLLVVSFSKIKNSQTFRQVMFGEKIGAFMIPPDRRIYVFEDFDANEASELFHKRELIEKQKEKERKMNTMPPQMNNHMGVARANMYRPQAVQPEKLTLSIILNVLDGVNERTSVRSIWTTNVMNPADIFDPAFLRPGRMDLIIKLRPCTRDGIASLCRLFYDQDFSAKDFDMIDDYVITPAQLKQLCKESRTPEKLLQAMRKFVNEIPASQVTSSSIKHMPMTITQLKADDTSYDELQETHSSETLVISKVDDKIAGVMTKKDVKSSTSSDVNQEICEVLKETLTKMTKLEGRDGLHQAQYRHTLLTLNNCLSSFSHNAR